MTIISGAYIDETHYAVYKHEAAKYYSTNEPDIELMGDIFCPFLLQGRH